MNQLLVTILIGATLACHATEQLSPEEQEYLRQRAIRDKFEEGQRSQEERLTLIKQHPFLRAPRIIGSSMILSCIDSDSIDSKKVQALLDSGVDIDQEGTGGRTALHEVAVGMSMFSHFLVRGLLAYKADPTKQDSDGYNALGIALTSNRCDRSVLMLTSHPKIACVVNQPMLVHTRMTTPLNALITTDNPSCIYRKDAIEKILDAGAQIRVQDICDSLESDRAYETILKRCSLSQLTAALPFVEQIPPQHAFSKKRELLKAIKEKTDSASLAVEMLATTPVVSEQGSKPRPSYTTKQDYGYRRKKYFKYKE